MNDPINTICVVLGTGAFLVLLWVFVIFPLTLRFVSRNRGHQLGLRKCVVISLGYNFVHSIIVFAIWMAIYLTTQGAAESVLKEVTFTVAVLITGILVGVILTKLIGRINWTDAFKCFGRTWAVLLVVQMLAGALYSIDDPIDDKVTARLHREGETNPEENLFYAMMGFHKARTENPHEAGRKIVEQYNRAVEAGDWETLERYANRTRDRAEIFDYDARYVIDVKKCLEFLEDESYRQQLSDLYKSNKDVMVRYDELKRYKRYESRVEPTYFAPMPGFIVLLNLNCLELAHSHDYFQAGDVVSGIENLKQELQFYRQQLADFENILAKMVSVASMLKMLEYYADLLDCPDFVEEHLLFEKEISPLTDKEASLEPGFTYELSQMSWLFQEIGSRRSGLVEDEPFALVPRLLKGLIWKPGLATNVGGRWHEELIDYTSQSPLENQKLGKTLPDIEFSFLENVRCPLAVNVISMALPSSSGLYHRVYSLDGYLRLVSLKQEIRVKAITKDAMPDFMSNTPDALRNPWTGEPMGWDPNKEILFFENPKSHQALEIPVPFTSPRSCPIKSELPTS